MSSTQAEPSRADIDEFTGDIKHMVTLQEQLRVLSVAAKESRVPVKEQLDTVQGRVIGFMKEGAIDVCNYQDEKIELHTVTRFGSLTRKTLKNGLDGFFAGDEARAKACFDHIIGTLGERQLDIIKRVRKRGKKKRARDPPPVQEEEEMPELGSSDEDE